MQLGMQPLPSSMNAGLNVCKLCLIIWSSNVLYPKPQVHFTKIINHRKMKEILQPGMEMVHFAFTQCRTEVNLRCEIVPWAGMQWRPDGSRWHSPIEAICLHFPSPFRCARPPIRHSTLPHPLRKKCTSSSKLAFTPIERGSGWMNPSITNAVSHPCGWMKCQDCSGIPSTPIALYTCILPLACLSS